MLYLVRTQPLLAGLYSEFKLLVKIVVKATFKTSHVPVTLVSLM